VRVRKDIFYLALQWCERKKIYAISFWHDLAKNTNHSQFLSRDQTLIRVPGIQSECLNRCSLKWHIFICDIALVRVKRVSLMWMYILFINFLWMFFEYILYFDWYCHFKELMYVNEKTFYEFSGFCILETLRPIFIFILRSS